MIERALGLRRPVDDNHIQRHFLTAETVPAKPTPVIVGIDWHRAFDHPVYDEKTKKYWVAKNADVGTIRGGHCVCLKPPSLTDLKAWWSFYDQGHEGACVGFGSCRGFSLVNRKRYDARWLYHEAQFVDDWSDTPPESGTSVRAAFDVIRDKGLVVNKRTNPDINEGISANKWASTVEEVVECLGSVQYLNRLEGVPFLNSWGTDYPHITWIPYRVLEMLLDNGGEATLFTDL